MSFASLRLLAAFIGFRIWAQRESARLKIDAVKLRVPVFGQIWVKYQVAQFSRVLSTLLQGGIPLVQALGTASESLGTPLLRQALDKAVKMVREGQALSASLSATGIFPALSIDMIEVGESTGALQEMLNSLADFYDEEIETDVGRFVTIIEPALLVIMGVVIAAIVLALYMPLFQLTSVIGTR